MADFNFVGASYVAFSTTQDNQECINWMPEVDTTKQPDERGVVALLPTPGLLLRHECPVAEVRALHTLPGGELMLAVVGNVLYSVTQAYVATAVGTLATSAGIVHIADNNFVAMLADGANRYSYDWRASAFAMLTDGAFSGADWVDEVDNFFVYNRPGTNQWGSSDVDVATSSPLNLGAMIGAGGNVVALIADHRQILLIGEQYSERWVNVGTFPFPFAIIPGSSMQHGTGAPHSIARLGEGIAFLSQDTRGNATVITWGAAIPNPQRISTFAVEQAIQSYAVTNDAVGFTYSQSGHEFYFLIFPTQNITWVYDLATTLWHKRAWRDPLGVYNRHRANCVAVFGNDIVVGDWQNGKIYALSQTTFTDDGAPLPCLRRCRHLTSDLRRQFFHDLQIQFQPGMGLNAGQGSDPECILRWSNDGGQTWGNNHVLKLGKMGKYRNRAIKRRLGWARDRVFEIVTTDPIFRVVVSANLNASAGSN
jgi:hypothetical protein